MRMFALRFLGLLLLLACATLSHAEPWVLTRQATDYQRNDLGWYNKDEERAKDKTTGFLRGCTGWAEYDFAVPKTGWYELWINSEAGWTTGVTLDGTQLLYGMFREQLSNKLGYKLQNVWLETGKPHALRISMMQWPGLWTTSFTVREGGMSPATLASVKLLGSQIVRRSDAVKLAVTAGGGGQAVSYTLAMRRPGETTPVSTVDVAFPATDLPSTKTVTIPCPADGFFEVVGQSGGTTLGQGDFRAGTFVVVDTKKGPTPSTTLNRTLLFEFDCTKDVTTNFWEKDGKSTVVTAPFGRYRETSGQGATPNWAGDGFSYGFDLPAANVPYMLEVDYPDNDRRSMAFWIDEQVKTGGDLGAVMTGGVETGDHYRLSNSMLTHQAIFYPRGNKNLRVAVINLNYGMKAAAARIRIYQIDGPLPVTPATRPDGRRMAYYFEEPSRWLRHFGANSAALDQHLLTLDRWAQMCRYTGANMFFPTICVYQANAYPSKVLEGYFNSPLDEPRVTALIAEKYGLKYVPEFAVTPQGWFDSRVMKKDTPEGDAWTLRDKNGKAGVYNALHPKVQGIYIALFGELADRLADCPAFAGISSRLMMGWQWTGFNVLPNLNWGYDDWTIAQFTRDTHITVPGAAGDAQRFTQRFAFLTGPQLNTWQRWRCARILDYHRRLRDRMRQAKPDAVLYFSCPDIPGTLIGRTWKEKLREVGIDMDLYAKEPGITLLPTVGYGRRMSTPLGDAIQFDGILDPDYTALGHLGARGYSIYGSYFEVCESMDWKQLGADIPGINFDANAPAGRNELELYALALAESDCSTFTNGGNGNIFGTARYLNEFLSEYTALPAEPFTALASGRDPVAVWYRQCADGFYFYAVNRERYPVTATLTLTGVTKLTPAASGRLLTLTGNKLTLTLEPFQLMSFKAQGKVAITECAVTVPEAEKAQLTAQLTFAETLAAGVASRAVAPELPKENADAFCARVTESRQAFTEGRYWRARVNLERPDMVRVYDIVGAWPPNLLGRQTPHGLAPAIGTAGAPKLTFAGAPSIIGDVRGKLGAVKDLTVSADGTLWVTSQLQAMAFDSKGQYLRELHFITPDTLDSGDARWPGLLPPQYEGAGALRVLPNGNLVKADYYSAPTVHESSSGRVLPLTAGNIFATPAGSNFVHLEVDGKGGIYLACHGGPNAVGVWKYTAEGSAAFDFGTAVKSNRLCATQAAGLAVDGTGRIYVSDAKGKQIQVYAADGTLQDTLAFVIDDGPRRITVSKTGDWLFVATGAGGNVAAFRRDADGKLQPAWKQAVGVQVTALAVHPTTHELLVGFATAVQGTIVARYTVTATGLTLSATPGVASIDTLYPGLIDGYTRLKAFQGALYYLSRGKLVRLTPGTPDKTEVVYDPGTDREYQSFAFAPNGDLYLGSNNVGWERKILVLRCAKTVTGWGKPVSVTGDLPLHKGGISMIPYDLAVDNQGRLLVRWDDKENWPNLNIYRREADGAMTKLADLGSMVGHGPWTGHFGIYVAPDGRIYIAGGGARKLTCLAADGKLLGTIGTRPDQGTGTLPLRGPYAVTTDKRNNVWVADTDGNRLLVFDMNGKLLDTYGQYGTADAVDGKGYSFPTGLATVSDAQGTEWLYVADQNNQRLLKYRIEAK